MGSFNPETFKPVGPWVLIKTDPWEEKTKGGIIKPQGNMEERLGHATGVVLKVGPGKLATGKLAKKMKYEPHDLKEGERVIFRGFLGEHHRPGGLMDKEHCIIHIDDVIARVE